MAFLQASPTRTIKLIWVKTLLSPFSSQTPAIAENRVIGTIRIITRGKDQLSYWAQRNHFSGQVSCPEVTDIFRVQPIRRLRLHVYLIGSPKAVEVIYIKGT